MNFNQYQELCKTTAIYPKVGNGTLSLYPFLGLGGEVGEVLEIVKKTERDAAGVLNEERKTHLIKELGDVLWYISAIATDLNIEFNEVAQTNIDKLAKRKENNTLNGSGDNR
jgi:NTP pyrophosphatase (non-canonical NTP hydrolase)